eukprot:g33164.t1
MEKRVTKHFNGTEAGKISDEATRTEAAAEPETSAETRRIGEGFWCHAQVLAVRGGMVEISIGGVTTETKMESLRAPKDNETMAWPKGTQVMYHSATAGRWIEAHIDLASAKPSELDSTNSTNTTAHTTWTCVQKQMLTRCGLDSPGALENSMPSATASPRRRF